MNSWLVWGGFAVAVVFLGWVAYHFTVRTLRFVALALVVAGVVLGHPIRRDPAVPGRVGGAC